MEQPPSGRRPAELLIAAAALLVVAALLLWKAAQPESMIAPQLSQAVQTEPAVTEIQPTEAIRTQTAPAEAATALPTVQARTFPLNLNTASFEDLLTVPGLGEKKASAIIEYRNAAGRYDSVMELANIKGFGETTAERLSAYLAVYP
ncbi:MAG: helix-hairpin-helix domain-containing protein [Oscillospiraceae bacterium]|jgi:competence protein ComEA|nr:helix-hairpin-helix domain-containing protein [Oscillospiraceae bacterium]